MRPARGQEPGLDPLPALGDVDLVQMRPEFVLGHAGAQDIAHLGHAGFGGDDGRAHGRQFQRQLDGPRGLDERLTLRRLDAQAIQRGDAEWVAAIDREAAVAAAVLAHQVGQFLGPGLGLLGRAMAGAEEVPGGRQAGLVDGGDASRDVFAVVEVEQHGRPVGRHEGVADRVVHGPDLHVRGVGGIADVDGVVEQDAGHVGLGQRRLDLGQALHAQLVQLGLGGEANGDVGEALRHLGHGCNS